MGVKYLFRLLFSLVLVHLVLYPLPVWGQEGKTVNITIKGVVLEDDTRAPIAGATIRYRQEGRALGCLSRTDGSFVLKVPSKEAALVVSFIGFRTRTIELQKVKDLQNIEILLSTKSYEAEELVVTGIQKRSQESFTGEYVRIEGKQLLQTNPNNILKALEAFDPSFRIVENLESGSDPNALPDFRMRGDVQIGSGATPDEMEMFINGYANRPNMPLFVLDGFIVSITQIMELEPERIEQVVILKDAAATSVYGSKAANGVIVFETKKPEVGRLRLSYFGNYGITMPDLSSYNMMNAEEKLQAEVMAGMFQPDDPVRMNDYTRYLAEVQRGVNTYWLSRPLRTAIMHRHSISAEGGDAALRYRLGISNTYSPGVMKGSSNNMTNLSMTLSYRYDDLNISSNTSLGNTTSQNSPYGHFGQYTNLNPYYRPTDTEGNYSPILDPAKFLPVRGSTRITNPLYDAQFAHKDGRKTQSFNTALSLDYALLPNLRLTGSIRYSQSHAQTERFKSPKHSSYAHLGTLNFKEKGEFTKAIGQNKSLSGDFSISYNYSRGAHVLSSFARIDIAQSSGDNISLRARGYPNDDMTDFLFGFEMPSRPSGNDSKNRSLGLIGQLGYMYDMKYSVDVSVRGDKSSSFGANTGIAPFWSIGTRWNVEREKWFPTEYIPQMTMRLSYGVTGSQNYSPYQAMRTYTYSQYMHPYESSNVIGAVLMGIGNDKLGWSQTHNTNFGVDMSLLKNRLRLSFSYYHNYTDQLLIDYTLAPSVGFESMSENAGAILNQGYQFNISGTPYENRAKRLQWTIALNAAHNRNVIKKISNALDSQNKANLEKADAPLPVFVEGESTTRIFTVPSLGIDPATGKEIYLDREGNKTFRWRSSYKVPMGDTSPKLTGSINSNVIWRNLSVGCSFLYNLGADRYNSTLVSKIENANLVYNADKRALTERWNENNRNAKYKGIQMQGSSTPQSSRFLQKVYELRFNSIHLNYRLDSNTFAWVDKVGLRNLNVGVNLSDLGQLSTVRLERGTAYPFARSITMTLSMMFK